MSSIPKWVMMRQVPESLSIKFSDIEHVIHIPQDEDGNLGDDMWKNRARSYTLYCMFNCYSYYVLDIALISNAEYDYVKELIKESINMCLMKGEVVNLKFQSNGSRRIFTPHESCYEHLVSRFYPDVVTDFFKDIPDELKNR